MTTDELTAAFGQAGLIRPEVAAAAVARAVRYATDDLAAAVAGLRALYPYVPATVSDAEFVRRVTGELDYCRSHPCQCRDSGGLTGGGSGSPPSEGSSGGVGSAGSGSGSSPGPAPARSVGERVAAEYVRVGRDGRSVTIAGPIEQFSAMIPLLLQPEAAALLPKIFATLIDKAVAEDRAVILAEVEKAMAYHEGHGEPRCATALAFISAFLAQRLSRTRPAAPSAPA